MNIELVKQAIVKARAIGTSEFEYLSSEEVLALVDAIEHLCAKESIEVLIVATGHPRILDGLYLSRANHLIETMTQLQVPKEVVYAYPSMMNRAFRHYLKLYLKSDIPHIQDMYYFPVGEETDDFGCDWKKITLVEGAEKFIDFLRENNVPIKVCK